MSLADLKKLIAELDRKEVALREEKSRLWKEVEEAGKIGDRKRALNALLKHVDLVFDIEEVRIAKISVACPEWLKKAHEIGQELLGVKLTMYCLSIPMRFGKRFTDGSYYDGGYYAKDFIYVNINRDAYIVLLTLSHELIHARLKQIPEKFISHAAEILRIAIIKEFKDRKITLPPEVSELTEFKKL